VYKRHNDTSNHELGRRGGGEERKERKKSDMKMNNPSNNINGNNTYDLWVRE
jgi:hypothetical protein